MVSPIGLNQETQTASESSVMKTVQLHIIRVPDDHELVIFWPSSLRVSWLV